jgi:hypothetical protein
LHGILGISERKKKKSLKFSLEIIGKHAQFSFWLSLTDSLILLHLPHTQAFLTLHRCSLFLTLHRLTLNVFSIIPTNLPSSQSFRRTCRLLRQNQPFSDEVNPSLRLNQPFLSIVHHQMNPKTFFSSPFSKTC